MKKLLFLIIASRDSINENDRKAQQATFARDGRQVKFRFLRGREELPFGQDNQDLFVDCDEKYINILEKTILGFQKVLKSDDFDFLVRSNVSTYFHIEELQRKLKKIELFEGPVVIGFKEIARKPNGEKEVFISGNSFIFNRQAVSLLAETDWKEYSGIPDDIALSREIKKKNIREFNIRRGNLHKTRFFFPASFVRAKSSEEGPLTARRLYAVHEYYSAKGIRKFAPYFKVSLLELTRNPWSARNTMEYMRDCYVLTKLYFLNSKERV